MFFRNEVGRVCPNAGSGVFAQHGLLVWKKCGITPPDPIKRVKKSLESDYPRPEDVALRPIRGFATAISTTL